MKEIKNNSIKADVSGSISIAIGGNPLARQMQSNSNFFEANEDYIIKINDEKIVIAKATIDYTGKTYKATKKGSGWVTFQIQAELPLGKFEFDADETNEDSVVIYYR